MAAPLLTMRAADQPRQPRPRRRPQPARSADEAAVPRRSRWRLLLLSALSLALLGAAAWVYTLPYLAASRLQDALQRNDATALAEEIDFATLRDNLKVRLNAFLENPSNRTIKGRLLGVVGSFLAGTPVNRVVDAQITPEGLGWLMLGKFAVERSGRTLAPSEEMRRVFGGAFCRYQSPSLFVITLHLGQARETRLFLARSGLSWRLVDIALPDT